MRYPYALKKITILLSGLLCLVQLNGCATGTAALECGAETMRPTILSTLDSFESAAISIKLSNRILLESPISEQDKWPSELFGAPSGSAMLSMGLSLLGSSQGITIPTQIDPQTGFPRPTSALYIFLTEREKMMNKEIVRDDVRFFATQPPQVIARQFPSFRRKANVQFIDDNIYRNPLMAYGVITSNRQEMVRLQQEIDLLAKGFKLCDAWVHKSKTGDVKPAACKDPALKQDALEGRLKKTSYTTSAAGNTNNAQTPASPQPAENIPKTDSFGNPVTASAVDTLVEKSNPEPPPKKVLAKNNRNKLKKTKKRRKVQTTDNPIVAQAPAAIDADSGANTERPSPLSSDRNEKVIVVNERDRLTGEKTEELETMKKNYGKLADKVYNASVAGADFTMAAITKLACAVVNGIRAVPNAQNEIRGWRGAYNAAMLLPRIKGVINAFGYYKDNLGLQFVAYRTMYQQIKGTYPDLGDESTPKSQEAMRRIENAYAALKQLEPKLELLAAGKEVNFEDNEIRQLNHVASLFPSQPDMERELQVAWGIRQ